MNAEVFVYPTLVAIPGIAWFFVQFKKHKGTESKRHQRWQLFKLIVSIVAIIVVAGLASFLVFASMLGHGAKSSDALKLMGSGILMYAVSVFLLGQWIQSTRLGNTAASIAFASGVFYLTVMNPIVLVEPLAAINITTAQYLVGYFYETGIGGAPKSRQTAWRWYSRAGKLGNMKAARSAVRLLPPKNYDRVALLKILAANEPDGEIYYDLWQSTFSMPYSSELERKQDAEKWLNLATEYGHRDAIRRSMRDKYSLERSCRLSPKAYEALSQFEKWVSAYENNRGKEKFSEKQLEELKQIVACLANKIAEAKKQDAQLGKLTQNLFSTDHHTQVNAIATVKKMGPRAISAIPNLLKLAHTKNSSTAWHALGAIKKIDPEGRLVTEEIMAMLKHGAPHIRVNGAYGVGLYADVLPRAIAQLDKLLEDPNTEVAGRAALALSEYGELANGSLEKIHALQKSRDTYLSSYARQAYNKIKYGKR